MSKTEDTIPFSHPLQVATMHGATHVKLRPGEAERAAIAKLAGLHMVDRFEAELDVEVKGSGIVTVQGTLKADVQPICVVSLEPFTQQVEEEIDTRFADETLIEKLTKRAEEEENEDFEPPEMLDAGMIDLGMLATEYLIVALDPYPRKPGAEFAGYGQPEEKKSPFDALKALKADDKK